MRSTVNKAHIEKRKEIESQTADFLKNGGVITHLDSSLRNPHVTVWDKQASIAKMKERKGKRHE